MREHRTPRWYFVAPVALALMTWGCGGAPARSSEGAASTGPSREASSAVLPTVADGGPGAADTVQTPGPSPTPAVAWPEMPSIDEVIGAAEVMDPIGDVSWRVDSGQATQPPGLPSIDVSRLIGWIAGETLYAEVTMEGQMPRSPAYIPALRLSIGPGSHVVEAPIICRPRCVEWGTFFDKPAFTYRVKQLPSEWVTTFAIDLSSLGAATRTMFQIYASAEAYAGDYSSTWYDTTPLLVVERTP